MIELQPVTEQEFPALVAKSIQGYADEGVAAGRWTAKTAYGHAKHIIDNDLPLGLHTPGHMLFHLISTDDKTTVGYTWLELMVKDDLPTLFVADIEIESKFRRQGFAVAAFTVIEKLAVERGIDRVCLHVFKHNEAAQTLYRKLGFSISGLNMQKKL